MLEIQYDLKTQVETLGSVHLQIDCLKDLNQTIDQVFEILESNGNSRLLEELCPYFGVVWPAARGLAEYLAEIPQYDLAGKAVLELGCGLALPSMIAAKKNANVLATDFHPEVEKLLLKNIQNNLISNISYQRINWESEDPLQALGLETQDWIIGSDLLYEQRFATSLANAIDRLLKPNGRAVIADPGRPYLQGFSDTMKTLGFSVETLIRKVPHPPSMQEVFVMVFERG